MSWTYSNWITQSTAASRLTNLRLHIQEVTDAVDKERGSDGFNESSSANVQLLETLYKRLDKLEAAAAGTNGGVSVARLVPGRNAG